MILYNKYLVNINMESATTTPKKNTRPNASARRTVQQKPFKAQNETVSNYKCEDKYSLLLTVQSDNYRDDTKENLDPVTPISCKSVADNLTVSASSNNQSDGDNPTKSVYNGTKVIEDNKRRHGEDAKLISNAESIFDAEESVNASPHATANCADKHFRSINNVKRTIQSLSSDLVASSVSATKLYQRGSRLNDHANCKIENRSRSVSGTRFKVSIDLDRIGDFIDDNPELFDKHKSENCKQSSKDARFLKGHNVAERINLPSRSATNSATDELKSFGDLTLSLPRNKMMEFRSRANESSEDIEDLMGADDLVQETRGMNSLSHNPTCNLKRTSSRFEKQCIFNR